MHHPAPERATGFTGWLYLLVLLEFQSTEEPRMALRILTYTSLLYQELVRNGALDAGGWLPVVLYTGEARWRAAVEVPYP